MCYFLDDVPAPSAHLAEEFSIDLFSAPRRPCMEPLATLFTTFGVIFLLLVLGAVLRPFFTVQTPEVALLQLLGKLERGPGPGLHRKTPLHQSVVRRTTRK